LHPPIHVFYDRYGLARQLARSGGAQTKYLWGDDHQNTVTMTFYDSNGERDHRRHRQSPAIAQKPLELNQVSSARERPGDAHPTSRPPIAVSTRERHQ
jgi:hypothetical protein